MRHLSYFYFCRKLVILLHYFAPATRARKSLSPDTYTLFTGRPLGESFCDPTVEICTLLGIREILDLGELEFPILLNKSANTERIVVKLFATTSM